MDSPEEISDEDIKAAILFKLYRLGKWGANHTDFENIKKGFKPKELGKKGLRRVEELTEELIREGYIIPKITSYGYHVSLNSQKSKEILKIIEEFMRKQFS
ncbi:MAG: hypothetical protein H3Z52_00735 [archaeon]|nr:hypothetical protein [archaeon]MCP8319457.1 hypothetical protein [archaeon]